MAKRNTQAYVVDKITDVKDAKPVPPQRKGDQNGEAEGVEGPEGEGEADQPAEGEDGGEQKLEHKVQGVDDAEGQQKKQQSQDQNSDGSGGDDGFEERQQLEESKTSKPVILIISPAHNEAEYVAWKQNFAAGKMSTAVRNHPERYALQIPAITKEKRYGVDHQL